jgi:hypothetical protein
VVLSEEKHALPERFDLGHVSFLGSDASQSPNLLLEWKRGLNSP